VCRLAGYPDDIALVWRMIAVTGTAAGACGVLAAGRNQKEEREPSANCEPAHENLRASFVGMRWSGRAGAKIFFSKIADR
jgi:hypothetical protein